MDTKNSLNLKHIRRQEEEKRTEKKAEQLSVPYVDLSLRPIEVEDVVTLPEKEAKDAKLAIVSKTGDNVVLACNEPGSEKTRDVVKKLRDQNLEVEKIMVSESSLEKAWQLYEQYSPPEQSLTDVLVIADKELKKLDKETESFKNLDTKLKGLSTNNLLKFLVMGGINSEASDIHFEPGKSKVRVRYRVDGVLQTITHLKKTEYKYILSRVKILSGLKINVHNTNQDGRFSIRIEKNDNTIKQETPVRVSIIPGDHGESIVMRLLGIGIKQLEVEELGIRGEIEEELKAQLSQPNGMILCTGPTSSGKTTSLYSFLRRLNEPETKIVTIEDPVEYNLEGIQQSQVDRDEGYDFKTALEAILRQNPNIMLVGEMRDPDSAQTAFQAALTGHLVFSTLHTNDAAGAMDRLKQLGVEEKLIPSGVNAVVGQRLVRRLCPHCKKKRKLSDQEKKQMEKALSLISPEAKIEPPEVPDHIYEPQGCERCMGTGYSGRVGVFEIFTINDVIEELILKNASTYEIRAKAMEQGMVTMLQDCLMKVIEGITSLEEVNRVAGEAKYIESLYGKAITSLLSRSLKIDPETRKTVKKISHNLTQLEEKLNAVESKQLLKWIGASALELRATDIHIEPEEDSFRIRFRIDGVLQDIGTLPKRLFLTVVSEVKKLCGLDAGTHNKTQEGRFKVRWEDKSLDTRVSIIPGGYGETVVIRLLRPDIQKVPLQDLGIRKYYKKDLNKELRKPNGIIFACGPTSAGKTTTLYATMSKLNKPGVKTLTIEDPIEYSLEGIIQTQVNEEEGYTFAHALRSILRQNPNILMVGEVRDPETAQTAIRASLTGHLVLSTLHTNDAASAFQRLINLKVEPNDIASSANMIISQRLVRRLCTNCRKKYKPDGRIVEKIKKELSGVPKKLQPDFDSLTLYKPQGCKKCNGTGYKGQIGLFEILFVNQKIEKLVTSKAPTRKIKKAALNSGMITVRQDGLIRAANGITTIEEVERVT